MTEGQSNLIVGDRGYNINAYDLDNGRTGKFLASSNGPVLFVEPPARVDPEALVGWVDCPAPSHHPHGHQHR